MSKVFVRVWTSLSLLIVLLLGTTVTRGLAAQPDHDPISIASDAELTLPDSVSGNGVRSGTGTSSDPYVIADWTIQYQAGMPAIEILSTTRHVVVRDIEFDSQWKEERASLIVVNDTANLSIEDLTLERPHIGTRSGTPLVAGHSEHLTVRNVAFHGIARPRFEGSTDVLIEDTRFAGTSGAGLQLFTGTYRLDNLTFRRSVEPEDVSTTGRAPLYAGPGINGARPSNRCNVEAKNIDIEMPGAWDWDRAAVYASGCEVEIEELDASRTLAGIVAVDSSRVTVQDARFTGDFDADSHPSYGRGDESTAGIHVSDSSEVQVETTLFHGFLDAAYVEDGGLEVRETRFLNYSRGIDIEGPCSSCTIHRSSFLSSDANYHAVNEGPSTLDARRNWWGSPDGPPGDMIEGDVLVEPWKTEGPKPPDQGSAVPLPGVLVVVALAAAALLTRPRSWL